MIDLGLTRHFVRRLGRWKRLLGLAALASSAGWIMWLSSTGESPDSVAERFHVTTATAAAATTSIAFLMIGTTTLRDERDGGTLPYLYLKPIPRWRWAMSAWSSAAFVSLGVGLVAWSVGWLATGILSDSWNLALPALSVYAAAAVGYTAVFVPIGFLFSRATLVGLAYIFVWEAIVTQLVGGLAASSVWRTAMSIYADLTDLPRDALDVLGPVLPGVGGGVLKLAGTVLVGTGVLTWALRQRDAL